MAAVTLTVPSEAHAKLAEIAAADRRPIGEVVAELIERERRRRVEEAVDAAYARLQADPKAWVDYQADLRSLGSSLADR